MITNFPFVNVPFICRNIPTTTAYWIYLSYLNDILNMVFPVTLWYRMMLLQNQVFLVTKLHSSFRKFYVRHHDICYRYRMSVWQITMDMFQMWYSNPVLSSYLEYHRLLHISNTMGATTRTESAYPPEAHDFTPFLLEFLLRNHRLFCVRFLFYFLTIVFFLISFGYCIVCISLIYGFWLQLYYHQKVFLLIYFNAHFTLGLALVLCNIIYTSLRCRQQFFSRIWGQIVTWSSSQFWEWFFSFVCSCISSLSSFWHIGW